MLERAGGDVSRPSELATELGIVDGVYRLSDAQAQAILDLRLHRLTGLEQDKIHAEFQELIESILDYLDILGSEVRLLTVIRSEEHTSELQSLMRISYAVFCLKKQTQISHNISTTQTRILKHTNKSHRS